MIALMGGYKVDGLNITPIMRNRLTFTGSTLRPRPKADKAAIAEGLRKDVWPELDAGRIRSVTHATFPLEQARQAHELMEIECASRQDPADDGPLTADHRNPPRRHRVGGR